VKRSGALYLPPLEKDLLLEEDMVHSFPSTKKTVLFLLFNSLKRRSDLLPSVTNYDCLLTLQGNPLEIPDTAPPLKRCDL